MGLLYRPKEWSPSLLSTIDQPALAPRTLLRPNNSSLVVVGGKVPARRSALIENDIVRIQLSSWVSIPLSNVGKENV
jgi:hypothetical protein